MDGPGFMRGKDKTLKEDATWGSRCGWMHNITLKFRHQA
jgi:hypothetical protein